MSEILKICFIRFGVACRTFLKTVSKVADPGSIKKSAFEARGSFFLRKLSKPEFYSPVCITEVLNICFIHFVMVFREFSKSATKAADPGISENLFFETLGCFL